MEEIKKKIFEREKIIEGLSYKKVENVHDDNKVIELVKEFITMVLDAHGIRYQVARNDTDNKEFLHIDLPDTDKYKELEPWNNASLRNGKSKYTHSCTSYCKSICRRYHKNWF